MKNPPSIALLIRSAQRWPIALQASNALLGFGAVVVIFFLGDEAGSGEMSRDKLQKALKDKNLHCISDQPTAGMDCLPLELIAQRLKQYEFVIPI